MNEKPLNLEKITYRILSVNLKSKYFLFWTNNKMYFFYIVFRLEALITKTCYFPVPVHALKKVI